MGNNTILSTIQFSSVQQWDVKRFFLSKVHSKYPVEELGNHLIHQTEKIQPSDYPDKSFIILGVSNKTGMFDAVEELGKKIKQKYHLVKDNWIAYNPYRINVGSIGIKTDKQKGAYISPAYVVISCKPTLLPEFLYLVMKSAYFNTLVKDSTTGSVRQTLHYEELASIRIPIPSIEEQANILNCYHSVLTQAQHIQSDGDNFSFSLLNDIQSMVSDYTMKPDAEETGDSILQIVPFSDTRRWEVGYILKEGRLETIYNSFKFKMYSISELQVDSLFGLSDKASVDQKKGMIPVLRMSNVVNGEIVYSDFKYLPKDNAISDKEPTKWLLSDGDFLITRTNGSKDLVGKSAVFHSDGIYTYASYLIRYRFDTEIVLPDYINILFMTPIVREQIAVMRRQGGGQYNLNSDEIGAIRIPVPSIQEQKAIIEKYYSTKDGANTYYQEANRLKEKAASDFEQAIFS